MPLLNYTTQVSTDKTVAEIQRILSNAGALAIMLEFSGAAVCAISFRIATPFGPTSYSLPCNVDAVHELLKRQMIAGKVPPRYVTPEQASRIGWRILKDWIEAQMALVQTRMVTLDQVFLPYARTTTGETVYDRFVNQGMSGLLLGSGGAK